MKPSPWSTGLSDFILFTLTSKPRKSYSTRQEQKQSCKSMNWQKNSDAVLEACSYLKH